MEAFWYTMLGAVLSAVISGIFARRSTRQLREAAEYLKDETRRRSAELIRETREVGYYVDALISYVEGAGIDVPRTAEGKPSRVIRREVADQLGIDDMAKPSLTEDEGAQTDDKQDA